MINKALKSTSTPYFWIVIGLFFCLISKQFLSKGMFLDGLNYAAIAHNLANGHGSFWQPYFSATHDAQFFSHPPLAIGMESLFFKWFGDSYLIEKIYSVITYLLSGGLIVWLWHELGLSKNTGWIPLLLWICFPIVSWAAPNNVLENTMTVFILASTLCYLKSIKKNRVILLLISSLLWLCAILCKGPTALFLLVFPIFFRLTEKEISLKQILLDLFGFFGGLILWTALLILIQPSAYSYFIHYYHTQIEVSFHISPTGGSHFYILIKWFEQIIFPLIITGLVIFISYLKRHEMPLFSNHNKEKIKIAISFLLTGLCGVIPIMVSAKQRDFYMLSALPFFAIGLSLFIESVIAQSIKIPKGKRVWILHSLAVFVCLSAIFLNISHYGKYGRDEVRLRDIERTLPYLQEGNIVNMPHSFASEWNLYGYYARIKNVSLKVSANTGAYYLFDHSTLSDTNYIALTPENREVFLYKRN